jgi:hypothetical protein
MQQEQEAVKRTLAESMSDAASSLAEHEREHLFALAMQQDGEGMSTHERQEAMGAVALGNAIAEKAMETFASARLLGKDGSVNIVPGMKLTAGQLHVLQQGGRQADAVRVELFRRARDASISVPGQDPAVGHALLGKVYDALFTESMAAHPTQELSGSVLNQLLDVRIERKAQTRQLRTNCLWFEVPSGATRKWRQLGTQSPKRTKTSAQLVEETLRVVSIPCEHEPNLLMCMDAIDMCAYMSELATEQGWKGTLEAAHAAGVLDARVPVPPGVQQCAGRSHLSRDQISHVIETLHCHKALLDLLAKHRFTEAEVESLLAAKDHLYVMPRTEGWLGSVWESLSVATQKAVNNLPALLKSFTLVLLVRWMVCGLVRMLMMYTCIEQQGKELLKVSVKAALKPLITEMMRQRRAATTASEGAKAALEGSMWQSVLRVFGGGAQPDMAHLSSLLEKADAKAAHSLDAAVDSIVDSLVSTLKGDYTAIMWAVASSMKAEFFGGLVTQFIGFIKGFTDFHNSSLVATVTAGFTKVCSLVGLGDVGVAAQWTVTAGKFVEYVNLTKAKVAQSELAVEGVRNVAAYIPGGKWVAEAISGAQTMAAPFLAKVQAGAYWEDIRRTYWPALAYLSGEVRKLANWQDWGTLEVGSVSMTIVQFLPRCCGLLSFTGHVLTLDAKGLLMKVPYADAAFKAIGDFAGDSELVKATMGKLDGAYALVRTAAGVKNATKLGDLIPGAFYLGTLIKGYSEKGKDGSKSYCVIWAEYIGSFIDKAAIAVLVYQTLQDIAAAGYVYKFGKMPPVYLQSNCIRSMIKDGQLSGEVVAKVVGASDKANADRKTAEGAFLERTDKEHGDTVARGIAQHDLEVAAARRAASDIEARRLADVELADKGGHPAAATGGVVGSLGRLTGLWGGAAFSGRRAVRCSPRLGARRRQSPRRQSSNRVPFCDAASNITSPSARLS